MCPLRWRRITGSTAWVTHRAPKKLVSHLLARLGLGGLFDRGVQHVAGTVDRDVDSPEALGRTRDHARRGGAIGHVELERERGVGMAIGQRLERARITGRQHDGVARFQRRLRKLSAQPP